MVLYIDIAIRYRYALTRYRKQNQCSILLHRRSTPQRITRSRSSASFGYSYDSAPPRLVLISHIWVIYATSSLKAEDGLTARPMLTLLRFVSSAIGAEAVALI